MGNYNKKIKEIFNWVNQKLYIYFKKLVNILQQYIYNIQNTYKNIIITPSLSLLKPEFSSIFSIINRIFMLYLFLLILIYVNNQILFNYCLIILIDYLNIIGHLIIYIHIFIIVYYLFYYFLKFSLYSNNKFNIVHNNIIIFERVRIFTWLFIFYLTTIIYLLICIKYDIFFIKFSFLLFCLINIIFFSFFENYIIYFITNILIFFFNISLFFSKKIWSININYYKLKMIFKQIIRIKQDKKIIKNLAISFNLIHLLVSQTFWGSVKDWYVFDTTIRDTEIELLDDIYVLTFPYIYIKTLIKMNLSFNKKLNKYWNLQKLGGIIIPKTNYIFNFINYIKNILKLYININIFYITFLYYILFLLYNSTNFLEPYQNYDTFFKLEEIKDFYETKTLIMDLDQFSKSFYKFIGNWFFFENHNGYLRYNDNNAYVIIREWYRLSRYFAYIGFDEDFAEIEGQRILFHMHRCFLNNGAIISNLHINNFKLNYDQALVNHLWYKYHYDFLFAKNIEDKIKSSKNINDFLKLHIDSSHRFLDTVNELKLRNIMYFKWMNIIMEEYPEDYISLSNINYSNKIVKLINELTFRDILSIKSIFNDLNINIKLSTIINFIISYILFIICFFYFFIQYFAIQDCIKDYVWKIQNFFINKKIIFFIFSFIYLILFYFIFFDYICNNFFIINQNYNYNFDCIAFEEYLYTICFFICYIYIFFWIIKIILTAFTLIFKGKKNKNKLKLSYKYFIFFFFIYILFFNKNIIFKIINTILYSDTVYFIKHVLPLLQIFINFLNSNFL